MHGEDEMKINMAKMATYLIVSTLAWAPARTLSGAESELSAGTRFLVELRTDLDAKRVKPGKKFEARTLEALRASDGNTISAGAKLKGRVSHVEHNKMMLRFEEIDTGHGKVPIVVSVQDIVGEKHVRNKTDSEGEIRAAGKSGRDAAIGATVLGGIGAAVGATQAGGKGAALGAGSGAAAGALIGAAVGKGDLRLQKGTRLDLVLDRPLLFKR